MKRTLDIDNTTNSNQSKQLKTSSQKDGFSLKRKKNKSTINNVSLQSIPPLTILRFERIGINQWDIYESKIFELDNFLSLFSTDSIKSTNNLDHHQTQNNSISHVYLLDELLLSEVIQSKQLIHKDADNNTKFTLGKLIKLIYPLAVLSTWTQPTDYSSLKSTLLFYAQQFVVRSIVPSTNIFTTENIVSLYKLATSDHCNIKSLANGCLAYEVDAPAIIILRKSHLLGIEEDIWRKIYPMELNLDAVIASSGSTATPDTIR